MEKWLYRILKVLLLAGLVYLRFFGRQWIESLGDGAHLGNILVSFGLFALSGDLLVLLVSGIYRRRKGLPPGRVDNVLVGLQNVYLLLMTGAVIFTLLGFFSIDFRTVFYSLSIVAAAIAIISKDYISEIISGIIISFSSELSIGDYVKIGEQKGRIIDITLTKVAILNEDDDVVFLPNNKVYTSEVVNYTKKEIRKVSIEFEVNMNMLHSVESLEAELVECLSEYHPLIEEQSYYLRTVEIRKDSLLLKFQYDLKHRDRELEREIRKKTVRYIVRSVKNFSS